MMCNEFRYKCVPKAQANLAEVRETGSTWEFHIPRIDTWGYLAETASIIQGRSPLHTIRFIRTIV
jgi:hypothetical protein